MADVKQGGNIKVPKLSPIQWVALRLPSGQTVLRHPSEIKPLNLPAVAKPK